MENPEDRSDEDNGMFAAASNEEDEETGGEDEEAEGEEEGEDEEAEGEDEEAEGEEAAEGEEEEAEGEEEGDEEEDAESDEEDEDEEESDEEDEAGEEDGGDGGDGGDDGDGGGGDDDDDDDDEDDEDGGELAELDDEEVFGSADDYEDASEEDFEDDDGAWGDEDYEEAAEHIFGQEEYYGESPDERYLEMGWEPAPAAEARQYAAVIDRVVPGVSQTTRFWNDGGTVKAQGFLPAKALREARKKLPKVDFSAVHATIVRKAAKGKKKPGKLPGAVGKIDARDVVDLRKYCSPVGDQGGSSRCSAFAWTHALEMALIRIAGKKARLSPSYTMWQIQGVQGDQDDFAYAASGGEGTQDGPEVAMPLVKKGCCRQELWADDEEEPSAELKKLAADAKSFRLPAKLVTIELSEVKKVLSSGNPVHLGMNTGEGFQAIGRDGLFKAAEEPSGQHGGHAMLIVGYKGNHFIVKNSWGTEWGDKGYCYIPKKVLQASNSSFVAVLLKEPG